MKNYPLRIEILILIKLEHAAWNRPVVRQRVFCSKICRDTFGDAHCKSPYGQIIFSTVKRI